MDLSNLFGYEEQHQQLLIQPQKVNDVKEPIMSIKSNVSKRGIKQNNKLYQFQQIMTLRPNKKGKVQNKNYMKRQMVINNQEKNLPFDLRQATLLKIQEYSEALKTKLLKIDIIVKPQLQEFNENKQVISKEDQSLDNLQNCLFNCLNQFNFFESKYPAYFFGKQIDRSGSDLKIAQVGLTNDNIFQNQVYSLPLIKFSKTYKHQSIKLDKRRLSATSKFFGCAICEESLSQAVVSKFAFKINKIDGNIAIGICNKDIIAEQNYQFTDSNHTQGLYLLDNLGRVYPNRENQVLEGQPFEFQESNIIILIVDFQKQYIKWKKYNDQSIICIHFDIHNEVYPCVVFSKIPQFTKTAQVRIVNPKILKKLDGSFIYGIN